MAQKKQKQNLVENNTTQDIHTIHRLIDKVENLDKGN